MKTNIDSNYRRLILLAIITCGCANNPEEPAWVPEARKIAIGMTRTEAEAHLPRYATIDTSFGSSGNHRDFYSVGEHWQVAMIYRAPMVTNLYFTEVSTSGQKILRGPITGWAYRPTPDQPVIDGPCITYVKSRGSHFADPLGGFTAEVPIRREPDNGANSSKPTR